MAAWVWTAFSCTMAGLSFVCSSIGGPPCNAFAFLLYGNKYIHTAYIVILPWLASTRGWLGCLAWEMQMMLTLLCLEITLQFDQSLVQPAHVVLCCNCDAGRSNDHLHGWAIW